MVKYKSNGDKYTTYYLNLFSSILKGNHTPFQCHKLSNPVFKERISIFYTKPCGELIHWSYLWESKILGRGIRSVGRKSGCLETRELVHLFYLWASKKTGRGIKYVEENLEVSNRRTSTLILPLSVKENGPRDKLCGRKSDWSRVEIPFLITRLLNSLKK